MGLVGLKIDFIDRDDQFAVKWYEDIAKTAAENHLMIDFHGAFKAQRPGTHLAQPDHARGHPGR